MWFCILRVASELSVTILRKWIYELRVPFKELQNSFTFAYLFCKLEIKLRVACCFFASCFLGVADLRIWRVPTHSVLRRCYFYKLTQILFLFWKELWRFKVINKNINLVKTRWNRKCKIPHTFLRDDPCASAHIRIAN